MQGAPKAAGARQRQAERTCWCGGAGLLLRGFGESPARIDKAQAHVEPTGSLPFITFIKVKVWLAKSKGRDAVEPEPDRGCMAASWSWTCYSIPD